MSLEYYLTPNQMTSDPDDYMAVSSNSKTYTIEDVYDYMTRQGSTITKAEALASYEEISRGIIDLIRQGFAVSTPLVNYSSAVSGVFSGEDGSFERDMHDININTSVGTRMDDIAAQIQPEKIVVQVRKPVLIHFIDNGSETQDQTITPGRGAHITGSLLKFDEEDNNQGVFFINTEDGSETRVNTPMLRNKPGDLIFLNPALPAGTYRVEVRSKVYQSSEVRTGALSDRLTVVGASVPA
jgi:hypothetical protein